MSTPTYTITKDADTGLATATVIFNDGSTLAVNSTNANYKAIVQAVAIDGADEDAVRDLMRPHLSVGKSLRALSERVRYDEGTIYFDGDAIDTSLAKHIVRILDEGGDENKYRALVNFMEKLYSNPSTNSIRSLYDFLLRQDFTILPNGDFIAYKGLEKDGKSIHAGYGIVDGVAFKDAKLQNNVGSVIEIPRSMVDDDTARGCSTGLHAGSYKYAHDFARGMLVTVQVNPRDVVSVPQDCEFQKIRTARYTVLAQTEVEDKRTTWAAADEDNDWEDDEDFEDEYDDEDGDEDRDEAEAALEAWRAEPRNVGRDFEVEPLSDAEAADLTEWADDYGLWLNGAEEDALEAWETPNALPANREKLAQTEPVSFLDLDKEQLAIFQPPADNSADDGDFTQYLADKPEAAEFAKQLTAEIEGDEAIVLNFDYTRNDGTETRVENFHPTEVATSRGDVLVTGRNAEYLWRSYYYGKMENLSVRHADAEPKHAS